jgi:hypothetical protein
MVWGLSPGRRALGRASGAQSWRAFSLHWAFAGCAGRRCGIGQNGRHTALKKKNPRLSRGRVGWYHMPLLGTQPQLTLSCRASDVIAINSRTANHFLPSSSRGRVPLLRAAKTNAARQARAMQGRHSATPAGTRQQLPSVSAAPWLSLRTQPGMSSVRQSSRRTGLLPRLRCPCSRAPSSATALFHCGHRAPPDSRPARRNRPCPGKSRDSSSATDWAI